MSTETKTLHTCDICRKTESTSEYDFHVINLNRRDDKENTKFPHVCPGCFNKVENLIDRLGKPPATVYRDDPNEERIFKAVHVDNRATKYAVHTPLDIVEEPNRCVGCSGILDQNSMCRDCADERGNQ